MKNQKIKKSIGTTITVLLAAVLVVLFVAVGAVLVQIVQGKTPSLLGYRFYYVLTDSMTPTYGVGDVVLGKVVTEKDVDKFTVGQVITYSSEYGEMKDKLVTHRIVEGVHYDEEMEDYVVVTRGDKAGAAPDKPVRVGRINAVIVGKLTVATWLHGVLSGGGGFALLLVVPLVLMLIVLVVRLVTTLKAGKAEQQEETPAVTETREEKIERLKRETIREYLAQKNNDSPVDPEDKSE